MFMKLSSIPVVKLPLVDVSTDPLDLLVAGLALRMKQLARTSPKFIELVHDRAFRIQIGTDLGVARQIIINHGHIDTVAGSPEKADFILQFADSEQGVSAVVIASLLAGAYYGKKFGGNFLKGQPEILADMTMWTLDEKKEWIQTNLIY